jgi:hypothetical protein
MGSVLGAIPWQTTFSACPGELRTLRASCLPNSLPSVMCDPASHASQHRSANHRLAGLPEKVVVLREIPTPMKGFVCKTAVARGPPRVGPPGSPSSYTHSYAAAELAPSIASTWRLCERRQELRQKNSEAQKVHPRSNPLLRHDPKRGNLGYEKFVDNFSLFNFLRMFQKKPKWISSFQ